MSGDPIFMRPWIPPEERRGLIQRLGIVLAVGLGLAAVTYTNHPTGTASWRYAIAYSEAISVCMWFFSDVPRFVLRGPLRSQAPIYWPPPWRAALMLGVGIPVGLGLGLVLGRLLSGPEVDHASVVGASLLAGGSTPLLGALLFSLAVSLGFVAFFYQRGRAQVLERQAQDARLKLLEVQLEPHMLFNTLANLRVLIGGDPARAQRMLDQLIDYLRATLAGSRAASHPLSDEFTRLDDYLSLMAIRMGRRLRYRLDLPDALASATVPTLLLQPLVENAIRHGLEPHIDGGALRISAHDDGDRLVLEVADTGVGLRGQGPTATANGASATPAGWREGFGLGHVRERLATLYGDRASVELSPLTPRGTLVRLQLPRSH